jgi:hypothetical protein
MPVGSDGGWNGLLFEMEAGAEIIVTEAAANALPAAVLHCPHDESDTYNYKSWQASYRKTANSRHSK